MNGTYRRGDIVEFISDDGPRRTSKGDRMEVEFYDEGFKPGDPEYGDNDYMQGPVVEGYVNGASIETEAEHVKLVTRAKDVRKPSLEDVARALDLDDGRNDLDWFTHLIEPEGNEVSFTFTDRETGRDYTARVIVAEVWRAD